MAQAVLRHATIVDGDGVMPDQLIKVVDGIFAEVCSDSGVDVAPGERDLSGRLILPGLIDLHNHGALEIEYMRASLQDARRAINYHLSHGTTSLLISLSSADRPTLLSAVGMIGELAQGRNPLVGSAVGLIDS